MRKPASIDRQKRVQAKHTARTVKSRAKAALGAKRYQELAVPALKKARIEEMQKRAAEAEKAAQSSQDD